jgi:hypothetical protein
MTVHQTDAEIAALTALKDALGHPVADPRYSMYPARDEARLKDGVTKIWGKHGNALRTTWVGWWINKWSGAAEGGQSQAVPRHTRVSGTFASHIPEGDSDVD